MSPPRDTRTVAVALLLLVTLAEWWARVATDRTPMSYSASDVIYLQTLVEDVLVRGGRYWHAWYLTPAPYFFPDGLFALAARAITADPLRGVAWAALFQLSALALGAWLALREVDRALAWLGPCVIALLALLGLDGAVPLHLLVTPVHHTGAAVVLLFLGAAATHFLRTGSRVALVTSLVLLAAGSSSDGLLVAGVSVSGALVAAWAWKTRAPLRVRWFSLLAMVVAVLGGQGARLLSSHPQGRVQSVHLERLLTTLAAMARDLAAWPPLTWVCAAAVPLSVVLVSRRRLHPLFIAWVLCGLGMLGGVVASGNVADAGWGRYVLWPVLAAALALSVWTLQHRHGLAVAAAFALVVVVATVRPASWVAPTSRITSPVPAEVQCVEALATRIGAPVVIADYWRAKPLVLFSSTLRAAQVQPDLNSVQRWIMSLDWFGPIEQTGLVIADGFDPAVLQATFGQPAEVTVCGSLHVHRYDGAALERLRARYAQWLRE